MSEASQAMNRLIRAGRDGGVLGRIAESGAPTGERAERFRDLTARAERAAKAGDAEERALVEHQLDELFAETRAARESEAVQPVTGFDGGVRRGPGPRRRPAGLSEPTAGQLFKDAFETSQRQARAGVRVPGAA